VEGNKINPKIKFDMYIKAILIIYILFVFFTLHADCQIQMTKGWDTLESRRAKIFVNEKGQHVGCDALMECMSFDPTFYSVSYDRMKREFNIKGTVYISGTARRDSIKLGSVHLYLAKPVWDPLTNLREDTLTNMREIGVTIGEKSKDAVFPNRRGDFSLTFIAEPNDKLYFYAPGYGLVEYNIDRVASGEVAL
jgi:hypothetical protein